MKKADFPNQSPLQPMPADVAPNISGNVNYDGSGNVNFGGSQEQSVAPLGGSPPATPQAIGHSYVWLIVILVALAIAIFFFWRWLKKKLF